MIIIDNPVDTVSVIIPLVIAAQPFMSLKPTTAKTKVVSVKPSTINKGCQPSVSMDKSIQ